MKNNPAFISNISIIDPPYLHLSYLVHLPIFIQINTPLLTNYKKCLGLQCQTPIWLKALVKAIFFVLSQKLSYSEQNWFETIWSANNCFRGWSRRVTFEIWLKSDQSMYFPWPD